MNICPNSLPVHLIDLEHIDPFQPIFIAYN
jgi:hypothetical protein